MKSKAKAKGKAKSKAKAKATGKATGKAKAKAKSTKQDTATKQTTPKKDCQPHHGESAGHQSEGLAYLTHSINAHACDAILKTQLMPTCVLSFSACRVMSC